MTNAQVAQGLLRQARTRLEAMKYPQENGDHAYVVRLSQEVIELSLKAALYFLGIDVPRWHDVASVLQLNRARFPDWFEKEIGRLSNISTRWREHRERSMYGDEEEGIPAHELYGETDSRQASSDAEHVYQQCEKLIVQALGEAETETNDSDR